MYIKNVKVVGFWGYKNLEVDFYHDATVFIGDNGSGKTTLLELINAALKVDIQKLSFLLFDRISFEISSPENEGMPPRSFSFSVSKREESKFELVFEYEFIFDDESHFYTISHARNQQNEDNIFHFSFNERPSSQDSSEAAKLREVIKNIVSVYSVNVHRGGDSPTLTKPQPSKSNVIDRKLSSLLERLEDSNSALRSQEDKYRQELQQSLVSSLLFSNENELSSADLDDFTTRYEKNKTSLTRALKWLGIQNYRSVVDLQFDRLSSSIDNVRRGLKGESPYNPDDFVQIALARRTKTLIEIAQKTSDAINGVYSRRNALVRTIRSFLSNKKLTFSSISGKASIYVLDSSKDPEDHRKIAFKDLSSGEKQLLILLFEIYLSGDKPLIFLADEPEMSLHIKWQEMLLPAMRSINPNAQLIVATHSPEIASSYEEQIIDMKKVFYV